tara:strand:- start:11523 stop:12407 length:885 start_codon:yes stop_codon:yes gene_type:complete
MRYTSSNDAESQLISRKSKNMEIFLKNKKKKDKCEINIQKDNDDTDYDKEHLLEKILFLENQLNLKGIEVEDTFFSYEDSIMNLKKAMEKAYNDDSYENLKDVEKWDTYIKKHPKYILEKETEQKQWVQDNSPLNLEAFNSQKTYIPENIYTGTSIQSLHEQGIELQLAKRIMCVRSLWIIRLPKSEIMKIHIADLISKYDYSRLDIIETRALYHCLPDFDCKKKNQWKNDILIYLKDLIKNNKTNRNRAYLQNSDNNEKNINNQQKKCKLLFNNNNSKGNLLQELKMKFNKDI